MRFPAMPRAVPWVFLALVVLTLSAVTAWPWRSTRTTRPSSRSSSRPSTTTSSSPPVAQEQPDGSLLLPWRTKPGPNAHFHKTVSPADFRCVLDKKLSPTTIKKFAAEIGDVWGDACGRNRGIFVLDPPDDKTYDCGRLPKTWGAPNVGSILTSDGETAYKAFGNYISAVYNTTIVKGITACDFNGLAYLECGREEPWKTAPWYNKLKAPIRSVNIGGLFVLEHWILPSFTTWGSDPTGIIDQHSFCVHCAKTKECDKLKTHWKTWYTAEDFKLMKQYNLNTIRLPVGWWYFAKLAGLDASPYVVPDEDILDSDHPITNVLRWANEAGLHIIFDLHGAPGSQNNLDNSGVADPTIPVDQWGENWLYNPTYIKQTVDVLEAVSKYLKNCNDQHGVDNIIMVEVVNEPWVFLDMGMVRDFYILAISAIRSVLPDMPVLLHDSFHGDEWKELLKYFPFDNVFMDTHLYHGFNVADVASDTYQADKLKMYVHERMACAMTSMLRFETCSAAPTIVGEWSLAIDNCMDAIDSKFANYGQCDRLAWRDTDPWWKDHIKSFAHRQIDVYERELGWSFWTWKLDKHAEGTAHSAPLWSFRLAVEKGYIDPEKYQSGQCFHNPIADYQGNTPPGGVAGGPVTTKPSPAKPAEPELVMTSQEEVPVTEMENVDIATPTEAVRGEDVPESHVPVTLMMLALTVTLLGVAVLAVRASGSEEESSFMRRILSGRRTVAQMPRMVLGAPSRHGYETVDDASMQRPQDATNSIQV